MGTAESFEGYSVLCRIVGKRHAPCWFTNFDVGSDSYTPDRIFALEGARQYAIDMKSNPQSGQNLIMMGNCGTGKDHLAVSVLRAALSFGLSVRYVRGSVLCNECRKNMLENAVDVPHELKSVDLLVISDIEPNSNKKATEFEERALMELIDYRYTRMLPTVVTSNKTARSELVNTIGERAVDRLWEGAVKLPMFWPSYRKR